MLFTSLFLSNKMLVKILKSKHLGGFEAMFSY